VLKSDAALEDEWIHFCRSKEPVYMSILHGYGPLLYFLNKKGLLTRLLYTRPQLRNIGNLVRCESHREVLLTLARLNLEEERGAGTRDRTK
jgi:poly-gamma-glutamate synthesis protein (capsule biosynthesis protein)